MPRRPRSTLHKSSRRNASTGHARNQHVARQEQLHEPNYLISISSSTASAPVVWRLLSVPPEFTFDRLNNAIAASFGYDRSRLSQFELGRHTISNGQPSGDVTVLLQDAGIGQTDGQRPLDVCLAEDVRWTFATMQETTLRHIIAGAGGYCLDEWVWEYRSNTLTRPRRHSIQFYGFEARTLRAIRGLHSSTQPACLGGEGCPLPDVIAGGDSWEQLIGSLLTNNPYRWDIGSVNRLLQAGDL